MAKQHTQQFKEDAVRYFVKHKELNMSICAKNLGISKSGLSKQRGLTKESDGVVPTRGRGNFESDEEKENAGLRKELRDTQGALAILKKAIDIVEN